MLNFSLYPGRILNSVGASCPSHRATKPLVSAVFLPFLTLKTGQKGRFSSVLRWQLLPARSGAFQKFKPKTLLG